MGQARSLPIVSRPGLPGALSRNKGVLTPPLCQVLCSEDETGVAPQISPTLMNLQQGVVLSAHRPLSSRGR